jgi:hypothetical protein
MAGFGLLSTVMLTGLALEVFEGVPGLEQAVIKPERIISETVIKMYLRMSGPLPWCMLSSNDGSDRDGFAGLTACSIWIIPLR